MLHDKFYFFREFEYTEFVKKERSLNYVCNEVAFAGPAIPYIYNFFRKK